MGRRGKQLPSLLGQISVVGYNPEHSSLTPKSGQNDLVATVQAAEALADQDGLTFVLVPDQAFDNQYASQLAPNADIYVLQAQSLETNTTAFDAWVNPTIATIRAASLTTQVFVQVATTSGTPQQMDNAIQTVAWSINGINIWTTPGEQSNLQAFIAPIRPAG
jgi:hypothetical protein